MSRVSFNPIVTTKKLLNLLENRQRKVLEERFGLISGQPRTLESIGKDYGITRERVRQIESFALSKIRQSDNFLDFNKIFFELKECLKKWGDFVEEESFLGSLARNEKERPYFYFLLNTGEEFNKFRRNEEFHHSWTSSYEWAEKIRSALKFFHSLIVEDRLYSQQEILSLFKKSLKEFVNESFSEDILLSYLKVSRRVASNSLGEWGLVNSPYINPRGMRDYAFLVMRKHGSPMHFSEVAKAIEDLFSRPAHIQTVHNELIKDERFVLVGRGLYALKEWGYQAGVVRNVIERILKTYGPLSKEEVVKKVLRERYVKESTILVNLQNSNYFKKDERGNYTLI